MLEILLAVFSFLLPVFTVWRDRSAGTLFDALTRGKTPPTKEEKEMLIRHRARRLGEDFKANLDELDKETRNGTATASPAPPDPGKSDGVRDARA